MKTNNELKALPGFFFVPFDTEGLVELTEMERRGIMADQGNYMALLLSPITENEKRDMACALDCSRIPTHRRIGVPMPAAMTVPFDLSEVIPL